MPRGCMGLVPPSESFENPNRQKKFGLLRVKGFGALGNTFEGAYLRGHAEQAVERYNQLCENFSMDTGRISLDDFPQHIHESW